MGGVRAAVEDGDREAVLEALGLFGSVDDPDPVGQTALDVAVAKDLVSVVHLLLERGGKAFFYGDGGGRLDLAAVAGEGSRDVLIDLLRQGYDPNRKHPAGGYAPIHAALHEGWEEIYMDLLRHGANPGIRDAKGRDSEALALETLCLVVLVNLTRARDLQVLETGTLVPRGRPSREELLGMAIAHGQRARLKELLEGVDLRVPGKNGCSPLYWAAFRGDLALVGQLLTTGAPVDFGDAFKRSPLIVAARYNQVAVIETLLASGASLDQRGEDGRTAVWHASDTGATEALQVLIKAVAVHEALGAPRITPLAAAVRRRHRSVVELLLAAGARPEGVDGQVRSPVDTAKLYRRIEMQALLNAAK